MSTLQRELAGVGAAITIGALLAVGVVTGTALYVAQQRATDRALLAAAGAWGESVWTSEAPTDGSITLRRVAAGPEADQELPSWHTADGRRVLRLPVERGPEGDEVHASVEASAPAVTVTAAVGPFAAVYGLVSAIVALGSVAVHRALVVRALRPLSRARRDVSAVLGAGSGVRVVAEGPDEVRELLVATNALLDRLDVAFAAQTRFTASAAHELRTPVAALLGRLDVALRRPREEAEYLSTLAQTRDDVQQLGALVDGLLALTRLDAGQGTREPARPGELVADALRRERPGLDRAGCTVIVDLDCDDELSVDRALAAASIANLLRNAAVHARGSAVSVRTERAGRFVRFVVEDRGPGVADPEGSFGGSRGGLGLRLAREVARRHGGDCAIEPATAGCRVVWHVPAAMG